MSSILGVDVGGTFTDFLLWEDGRLRLHKRPSTPEDPARGVLAGLREMAARPQAAVHGSTIATNALIERKGAPTALVTTRGFRDVLVIGRQTRPKLYDLSPQRPPPLVPDDLRLEVSERLNHDGQVLVPLDAAAVEALLDKLVKAGVESVAVCFLFSFLNPEHERMVAEAARRRRLFVSASHEVLPEHREYERTSTTVVNAYVSPVMSRYLSGLAEGLSERGMRRLRVMQSNGGSMSPQAAGRLAVRTVVSGPAAGVVGAFHVASRAGFNRIITLDMGGTSTDVSLCPGGISERDETYIGEMPLRGPTVDVISVGAGGGSLAYIDQGGALRVGPESAGADPGPACYGKSLAPTLTDAQVTLGRIVPEHFLGGRMPIQPERSQEAIRGLAAAFARPGARRGDGGTLRAAAAIIRVANANMERALRVVSVERGHDPRLLTLVAFGGAGPLHACELAESLRIPRVLVPPCPGVLSALGTVAAPPTKDLSAAVMAVVAPQEDESWPQVAALFQARFAALRERALAELRAEGFSTHGLTEQRFLEMRYLGQSYELSLPVDELSPACFLPRFHALHQERYSHSEPWRPTQVVNIRLKLIVPGEQLSLPPLSPSGPDAREALIGRRPVWFPGRAGDKPLETPIYERSRLRAANRLLGPAIVVQMDSTTAIPPGWQGTVDSFANLILERRHA